MDFSRFILAQIWDPGRDVVPSQFSPFWSFNSLTTQKVESDPTSHRRGLEPTATELFNKASVSSSQSVNPFECKIFLAQTRRLPVTTKLVITLFPTPDGWPMLVSQKETRPKQDPDLVRFVENHDWFTSQKKESTHQVVWPAGPCTAVPVVSWG